MSFAIWYLCSREVALRKEQVIPSHTLATSVPDGNCYLETKNLDGETSLKLQKSLTTTSDLPSAEDVQRALRPRLGAALAEPLPKIKFRKDVPLHRALRPHFWMTQYIMRMLYVTISFLLFVIGDRDTTRRRPRGSPAALSQDPTLTSNFFFYLLVLGLSKQVTVPVLAGGQWAPKFFLPVVANLVRTPSLRRATAPCPGPIEDLVPSLILVRLDRAA
ncbi:hypothetical protein B0H16DRAFT_1894735 [Mycena metata]|uniref:Uncharacterized protein n=1 Tax=Mycena metata TaxID=1033252 RepID=A0AAD7HR98_9AGAR|nr:hypothetical protein B0H16DRAFT_1894735 [Mycena metata]